MKGHNYNTILQLDLILRKEEKCVTVTYMLLFLSQQNMPDLCPKGVHLGVKPSAPSCPLTLPLHVGLPTEQGEDQGTFQEGLPQSR